MNSREARIAAKSAARRAATLQTQAPTPVPPPVSPAPPTPAQVARASARLDALKAEIAAFKAGPAPKPFPGPHECIDAEAYPPSPSRSIHNAAIAILATEPTMSYRRAVEIVSRRAS